MDLPFVLYKGLGSAGGVVGETISPWYNIWYNS